MNEEPWDLSIANNLAYYCTAAVRNCYNRPPSKKVVKIKFTVKLAAEVVANFFISCVIKTLKLSDHQFIGFCLMSSSGAKEIYLMSWT